VSLAIVLLSWAVGMLWAMVLAMAEPRTSKYWCCFGRSRQKQRQKKAV
jgi:hypothetical protein